jgi:hypothetical protein
MVKTSQNLNIISTTLACILIGDNLAHAWSNMAIGERRKPFGCNVLKTHTLYLASSSSSPLAPSSSLGYQNNHHYEDQQPHSSNSVENVTNNNEDNELDAKLRLQLALQAAREADRTYGLCSPASKHAWKIVDDVYSSSSASREVEDSVKRVLGGEVSVWEQHF